LPQFEELRVRAFRHGAPVSVTNGAAGGPSTVMMPDPDGMLSPSRTSPCPWIWTPTDIPTLPIGRT
jgi:hypothetical protein